MPIIDYKINGETFYTHTHWLSGRQKRAWFNIPSENKNLAINYTLSSLALVGIASGKIKPLGAFFQRVGYYSGGLFLAAGTFLTWSIIMSSRTSSQLYEVIEANDCLNTPFWRNKEAVVNLFALGQTDNYAFQRYQGRLEGSYQTKQQIEKFKPDFILENPQAKQILESLQ